MKVVIIFLAVLAFIAGLVFALYLWDGLPPVSGFIPTPDGIPTQTQSSTQQHTIVLIQADDLTSPNPHVVGIWLLFYYPQFPKLTLLMLYPPMSGNNRGKIWALGQQFAMTPDGKLSPTFLVPLQNFGFKSNGYLVMDNFSLTQWVDWLGGVTIDDNPQVLDGASILSKLPNADENGKNTGTWMKLVSAGVCNKLTGVSVDSNWAKLMNSIAPDHFHSDLSLELMMGDWKKIKDQPGPITCEFDIP